MKLKSLFKLGAFALLSSTLIPTAVAQNQEAKPPAKKKGFRSLDTDKNGLISKEELAAGRPKASPEKIDQKFRNLDKNKDGGISKEELWGKASPPDKDKTDNAVGNKKEQTSS
ncbi:MAG: EF-hand domain-containing protein [Chthoniobacterales bacterium]